MAGSRWNWSGSDKKGKRSDGPKWTRRQCGCKRNRVSWSRCVRRKCPWAPEPDEGALAIQGTAPPSPPPRLQDLALTIEELKTLVELGQKPGDSGMVHRYKHALDIETKKEKGDPPLQIQASTARSNVAAPEKRLRKVLETFGT